MMNLEPWNPANLEYLEESWNLEIIMIMMNDLPMMPLYHKPYTVANLMQPDLNNLWTKKTALSRSRRKIETLQLCDKAVILLMRWLNASNAIQLSIVVVQDKSRSAPMINQWYGWYNNAEAYLTPKKEEDYTRNGVCGVFNTNGTLYIFWLDNHKGANVSFCTVGAKRHLSKGVITIMTHKYALNIKVL
jgi:hypothetical protein